MRLHAAAMTIVAALDGDGVAVYPYEPDTLTAPAAYLGPPRQAYVDPGMPLGCFWLREIPITLVIARQSERDIWRRLDEMETWCLERLGAAEELQREYSAMVRSLEQARPIQLGGASYVAEDVVVQVMVR